jgi:hypothetical protein
LIDGRVLTVFQRYACCELDGGKLACGDRRHTAGSRA